MIAEDIETWSAYLRKDAYKNNFAGHDFSIDDIYAHVFEYVNRKFTRELQASARGEVLKDLRLERLTTSVENLNRESSMSMS